MAHRLTGPPVPPGHGKTSHHLKANPPGATRKAAHSSHPQPDLADVAGEVSPHHPAHPAQAAKAVRHPDVLPIHAKPSAAHRAPQRKAPKHKRPVAKPTPEAEPQGNPSLVPYS
jgi:hypothetical protein